MKKIFIPIVMFFISCNNVSTNSNPFVRPLNFTVGQTYVLCPPVTGNPFEQHNSATVFVEGIKSGWVKYCHRHQKDDPNHLSFYRSFEEFEWLIKNCSK